MPIQRVSLDALEAKVAEIERTSRVVNFAVVGDGAVILLTEPRPARETR